MFDVVSIEVDKEFFQPLVHDLVVGPSDTKFPQENRPTLTSLFAKGSEYRARQVVFNRLPVSLVEFTRPIVRRSLGAHIIASAAKEKKQIERGGKG